VPSNVAPFPGPRSGDRGPHRQDRNRDDRNRNRGRDREESGPPVVGLGDHVPAFLLRPVRVSSAGG
jgi:hypothetical protein